MFSLCSYVHTQPQPLTGWTAACFSALIAMQQCTPALKFACAIGLCEEQRSLFCNRFRHSCTHFATIGVNSAIQLSASQFRGFNFAICIRIFAILSTQNREITGAIAKLRRSNREVKRRFAESIPCVAKGSKESRN